MTIAALMVTASISGATASAPPPPPAVVIGELFRAFNRHDASALQALYAPNARLTSSDFCTSRTGSDVARTYRAIFRDSPGIRDDVTAIVAGTDQAFVRFVTSGVQQGRPFKFELMTFFRFRGGRIVEDDTVFDSQGRPCAR